MSNMFHHPAHLRLSESDYQSSMEEWTLNNSECLEGVLLSQHPHGDCSREFAALGLNPKYVRNIGIADISRGPELWLAVFEYQESGKPSRWFVREHQSEILVEIPDDFALAMQRCLFHETASDSDLEIGRRVFEHVSRKAVSAMSKTEEVEKFPFNLFEAKTRQWQAVCVSDIVFFDTEKKISQKERSRQQSSFREYFSGKTFESSPVAFLPWFAEREVFLSRGPAYNFYVIRCDDAKQERWFACCEEFDSITEIPVEMGRLLMAGLDYDEGRDSLSKTELAKMDAFLDSLFHRWYAAQELTEPQQQERMTSSPPAEASDLNVDNREIVVYGRKAIRLPETEWLILHRLVTSGQQTISVKELCDTDKGEAVWRFDDIPADWTLSTIAKNATKKLMQGGIMVRISYRDKLFSYDFI